MSAQQYKPEKFDLPHEDVADPEYEQGADSDYDDATQASYDEGAQVDYDTEFIDPDAQEASQEWVKRSQK